MRRLIILFLILLFSVWIGLKLVTDPGYVLLAYHKTTVEMPLWFFILGIIIVFAIIYILFRFIHRTSLIPDYLRSWSGKRQHRISHSRTSRGLIEFSEGNWQPAEKYLIKAVSSSESPLINYLAAARAAQAQGAFDRRDKYLRQAQKAMPNAKLAIELTQAQLQLTHGQFEQALATLKHLHSINPQHPYVLQLLQKLYLRLEEWEPLRSLLPRLRKRQVLSPNEYAKLETTVYSGLLDTAARKTDQITLTTTWQTFPRHIKHSPVVIAVYAKHLIASHQGELAEHWLRARLKKQWDDKLIELYGKAITQDPGKQIAFAESLLKNRTNHPVLLLTLGRLCIANQLWGKARTYLENSLAISSSPETYQELAELLQHLQEPEQALSRYREGLNAAIAKPITHNPHQINPAIPTKF